MIPGTGARFGAEHSPKTSADNTTPYDMDVTDFILHDMTDRLLSDADYAARKAAIADWNAAAVVTLVEDHELKTLKVSAMGEEVRARHMIWHHLPITDVSTPDAVFEATWEGIGEGRRPRRGTAAEEGGRRRVGLRETRILVHRQVT